MQIESMAGVLLYISAGVPVTYDAAGYAAVSGYVSIGEIVDVGNQGATHAETKVNTIAGAGTRKIKGSFDLGTKSLKIAVDNDDLGQQMLYTMLASYANAAFKQVYQNGDIDYFSAKVMSIVSEGSTPDAVRSINVGLAIDAPKGSGIIHVLA